MGPDYGDRPPVYSCSDRSSAAQVATDVAVGLDRDRRAETSCLAGVGGDVAPLVETAGDLAAMVWYGVLRDGPGPTARGPGSTRYTRSGSVCEVGGPRSYRRVFVHRGRDVEGRMTTAGGASRWTRRFVVASALWTVVLQGALFVGSPVRTVGTIGVFGAVLPMVFGMAYLLVPAVVGRTLSARWWPGVHFVAATAGAAVLAADRLVGLDASIVAFGALCWSLGVAVFVATLAATVVPAVRADPAVVVRSAERPQRSTRLATAAIPVAFAYLLAGTVALLSATTPLPDLVGATLPVVVHYYAVGFAALLVFAFGARLLTGFFHVDQPKSLSRAVLVAGAVAPGVLAPNLWRPPAFRVGAALVVAAMLGYAALVGLVALRTDRRRVGLVGIGLGATAGALAVVTAGTVAFGADAALLAAVHVPLVLDGFLLLTIWGYAYQFFPVTTGRFPGATERTARATLLLLALGTALQAVGASGGVEPVRAAGAATATVGAAGYAYLLTRRFA
ncbi:MAG: putative zinc-binding protein [Halosimplex sp.]